MRNDEDNKAGERKEQDNADEEDRRLREVFDAMDRDANGQVEPHEMQAALRGLGLPCSKGYVRDLYHQYDTDGSGGIDFAEFKRYVGAKEEGIKKTFARLDHDGSGHLDAAELLAAVKALGLPATRHDISRMIELLDADGDGQVSYQEFRRFVVLLPGAQASGHNILAAWIDSADWVESMEYRLTMVPPRRPLERFLAGGVAGAVSRTAVAPLERLRTIMMADASAKRLGPVLRRMWTDPGGPVRGLFRGNMATVAKVFPSSAIQFSVYDSVKVFMQASAPAGSRGDELGTFQKLTAGLIAGAAACTCTYPLETLRTQVSVSSGGAGGPGAASGGAGYAAIVRAAVAERGVMGGLFKGYRVGLMKDSITQALGFASYEGLCSGFRQYVGEQPPTGAKGVLGGASAMLVMSATMPLENVMRRLQVQGRPGFPQRYNGGLDCVKQMLRNEGVASFWRGSLGSYLKVVPSIAATRMLYEGLVSWFGIGGVRQYRSAAEEV